MCSQMELTPVGDAAVSDAGAMAVTARGALRWEDHPSEALLYGAVAKHVVFSDSGLREMARDVGMRDATYSQKTSNEREPMSKILQV